MRLVPPLLTFVLMLFAGARVADAQARTAAAAVPERFFGGVPAGALRSEPLALTIVDAINRALEHNLGVLNAQEEATRARGDRWLALADLLPNVNARLGETRQKINLAAFGIPLPPGRPPIVGPIRVFDARVSLSQSVVDFHALNSARAERHHVAAANYAVKSTRDLVVLVAANAYLQSLAAAARAETARAQAQSAEAIFQLATHMKEGGIVASIDVLRAEVQFGIQRQRATAAQNDADKARLQLARIIGLPIGQPFTLSDEIPFVPTPDISLDQALEQAYRSRPDYLGALERVRGAEAERRAIVGEALPALRVSADVGAIGLTPGDARRTYSVVGAVTVPIFQGGRLQGRLLRADADLNNRRAEAEDLKASIYYDVRGAFLDLQSSAEQLQVATRGRELAAQQLAQARDRFAAGVANNVEVIQAQEAVAVSSDQYISALYSNNIAKALLARGLGIAEQATRQSLGGVR